MDRQYAIDPMNLADALGIPRDEANQLLGASDHAYDCRCDICRQWWRDMGLDPDTDQYGPFGEEEING